MEENQNQALSVAPSTSMDKRYEGLINEIKAIEAELLPELETLSKTIDTSFGNCAKNMNQLGSILIDTGLFSEKNNAKIQLACDIGEKLLDIGAAVTKAVEHNKFLDRLLVTKAKYVAAKQDAIMRLSLRLDNLQERTKAILMKRMEETYQVADLADEEVRDMLVVNIIRETLIFKTTDYYQRTFEYMLAEFNAWNEGRQYSDTPRPCYRDVNADIFNMLFSRKEAANILQKMLIPYNAQTISAPQLLLLTDDQIAAYALQLQSSPRIENLIVHPWTPESDEFPEYEHITDILDHHTLLPFAQELLNKNKAYTDARENLSELVEVSGQKIHVSSTIFGLIALGADIWVFFYWLEWAAWIRWTLFILCGIIILTRWKSTRSSEKEEYEKEVTKAFRKTTRTLLKDSGYQKHDVSHLNRKSAVKEGAKAALKALGDILSE